MLRERPGGDEFVLAAAGASAAVAAAIASRLLASLAQPFAVGSGPVEIRASTDIAADRGPGASHSGFAVEEAQPLCRERARRDKSHNAGAIRPACVGRHNWLYADTVAGANASANAYPLVRT